MGSGLGLKLGSGSFQKDALVDFVEILERLDFVQIFGQFLWKLFEERLLEIPNSASSQSQSPLCVAGGLGARERHGLFDTSESRSVNFHTAAYFPKGR